MNEIALALIALVIPLTTLLLSRRGTTGALPAPEVAIDHGA